VPLLSVQEVTKTYATGGATLRAVDDVSFELERGEFVAITGHSGSGKTTLLSIVGALTAPSAGKVLFDGVDVHALDEDGLAEHRCERVGFVFQFASLLPALTARENLLLPVGFRSRARAKAGAGRRALELLDQVGLADRAGAYPAQLSGGQQRRVAIARAFMNDPALVLADEPTGDLDEETEAEVMRLFAKMNEAHRTAFLMVTHDLELASGAPRRMIMHRGRMKELDPRTATASRSPGVRPPASMPRSR
jgi:putative ABC transport system ATP-binding protein/lipoprotein-releasing system ATP-binding protein